MSRIAKDSQAFKPTTLDQYFQVPLDKQPVNEMAEITTQKKDKRKNSKKRMSQRKKKKNLKEKPEKQELVMQAENEEIIMISDDDETEIAIGKQDTERFKLLEQIPGLSDLSKQRWITMATDLKNSIPGERFDQQIEWVSETKKIFGQIPGSTIEEKGLWIGDMCDVGKIITEQTRTHRALDGLSVMRAQVRQSEQTTSKVKDLLEKNRLLTQQINRLKPR